MMRQLAFALVAALAALPAQDDRDRTTKIAAQWDTTVTPLELVAYRNSGWRATDLEIASSSPWQFTVSLVENTGTYQKTWDFVYGVTQSQLSSTLSAGNWRIVDIETYDDGGTIRYAAILIANAGADAKTWWWYPGQTAAQVNSNVQANNGRLVCFDRYTTGGVDRFTTVMIANTGADFRNWGYLYGQTAAQIGVNLNQFGNRIYGIERIGVDSYDVILVQSNVTGWWWGVDMTASQLTEALQQNVGRLVDVERHSTLLGTRYTAVILDNTNALERTARNAFLAAPAAGLGDYGFFLKEVDGPVLAEMRPDTVFEPASTMKTLYHVHAMRRVLLGMVSLGTQISKPIACGVPGANQSLQVLLREMMEQSDNMSTLAVSNHFGIPNIQNTATALGMTSTDINFTLGCQGPTPGSIENQMTLRDLSRLHEQVANGYLGGQRDNFYELMDNRLSFPSWGQDSLNARIDAEAASRGMPVAVREAFKSELLLAYKPGGIGMGLGDPLVWTYYYAEGGFLRAPFKAANGALAPREYTFGVFNHAYNAQEFAGSEAMAMAELALVWDRVRAALLTWDNFVPGSITPLIGAGCAGANGIPQHAATGTPEIGATVTYTVTNAPTFSLCAAMFGTDNQTYNGLPLPLNLGLVGAPGCNLRVAPIVFDAGIAVNGQMSKSLTFGASTALIGAQLYSQFLVNDPGANAFGWTISNAVRTTLGGWL